MARKRTAVIAAAASLSGPVNIGEMNIVALGMPAAWDAAGLSFQASYDNGATFKDVYEAPGGGEKTATVAAGRLYRVDPRDWVGITHLKIRSGTAAAPVAQLAERVIDVIIA